MRISTTDAIISLWKAGSTDRGNPALRGIPLETRRNRVACLDTGEVEITDKYDKRGIKEGVVFLNPYEGFTSVINYSSVDVALKDKNFHVKVANEIQKAGLEAVNDYTVLAEV
jgi:hypothetical protein